MIEAGRRLPLTSARAVGGPVALRLLGAYFAVALAGWLASTVAALVAAPKLAAAEPDAAAPVLAAHLLALGVLPFAVSGAAFHLLPVMLRNDLPSQRALRVALPLLLGGFLVGPGVALDLEPLVWPGAALVSAGLAIVLWELGTLVVRAPRDRMLVASRTGVALSCFHVAAALALGAFVFGGEDRTVGGVTHDRWMLIHLHVALLGWLALLIVAVGRTLGPMLALAPAAPRRSRPLEEVALTGGLWLLLAGLALANRPATLAGGIVVVVALGVFAVTLARSAAARRGPLEAPLAHLAAGVVFLVQAAAFGLAAAAGAGGERLVTAYVVLLLVGWAGGVVLGHVGKLLSLSLWVWWPPGPRPKQSELYARRTGLAQATLFAVGVETLVVAILAGSPAAAYAGAALLCGSATLAAAGAAITWSRRPAA